MHYVSKLSYEKTNKIFKWGENCYLAIAKKLIFNHISDKKLSIKMLEDMIICRELVIDTYVQLPAIQ